MVEATSKEQPLISKEWTVEVKKILKESEQGGKEIRVSMRVPKALINAKAEAYIPQMLSLGPYHHRSLQEEAMGPYHERLNHLSQMDYYKLNSTKDAVQNKLNSTKDAAQNKQGVVDDFLVKVTNMASAFEKFYDWKINDKYKEEFGRMMMVDAFFLYQFLHNGLHVLRRESSQRQKSYPEFFTTTLTSIRCDIVKLENQIPLSLLQEIDKTLKNNEIDKCLNSNIPSLSCFQVSQYPTIEYKDEHHFLGCMHKYVSSLLKIHNPDENKCTNLTCRESLMTAMGDMVAVIFAIFFPHPAKQGHDDFLDKYNAKELVKAGIKFKPGSDKIMFEKHSDTLFIPKIVISDTYTEVIMRNLLALEFNDPNRPKNVTQYVELMDCLIDTAEDVALLRKSHVIDRHSMMITDEQVAKMWDGMAKPLFFSGFLEHAQDLKAGIRETLIKNYYKSKIRNIWAEFQGEHLSRPWKALALLTAILVVGLTAAQTYCAFAACQKKS